MNIITIKRTANRQFQCSYYYEGENSFVIEMLGEVNETLFLNRLAQIIVNLPSIQSLISHNKNGKLKASFNPTRFTEVSKFIGLHRILDATGDIAKWDVFKPCKLHQ